MNPHNQKVIILGALFILCGGLAQAQGAVKCQFIRTTPYLGKAYAKIARNASTLEGAAAVELRAFKTELGRLATIYTTLTDRAKVMETECLAIDAPSGPRHGLLKKHKVKFQEIRAKLLGLKPERVALKQILGDLKTSYARIKGSCKRRKLSESGVARCRTQFQNFKAEKIAYFARKKTFVELIRKYQADIRANKAAYKSALSPWKKRIRKLKAERRTYLSDYYKWENQLRQLYLNVNRLIIRNAEKKNTTGKLLALAKKGGKLLYDVSGVKDVVDGAKGMAKGAKKLGKALKEAWKGNWKEAIVNAGTGVKDLGKGLFDVATGLPTPTGKGIKALKWLAKGAKLLKMRKHAAKLLKAARWMKKLNKHMGKPLKFLKKSKFGMMKKGLRYLKKNFPKFYNQYRKRYKLLKKGKTYINNGKEFLKDPNAHLKELVVDKLKKYGMGWLGGMGKPLKKHLEKIKKK